MLKEALEPTYGLPAVWIRENAKESALAKGYTVVDTATVMTTHLSEAIRRHAHELLGRQEAQQMLDHLKQTHPKVVEELVPNLLPLGAVVKVLHNLLREQVPIRDLLAILEALGDWAALTKDTDALTEHVRQALARTLTKMHAAPDGTLSVITLSHGVESALADALQKGDHGRILALDPGLASAHFHLGSLYYRTAGAGGSAQALALRAAPNPTGGRTTLHFEIDGSAEVEVQVFDVAGRLVRRFGRTEYGPGEHAVLWDGATSAGQPAPAGIYFFRAIANDRLTRTARVLVVR